MCVFVKISCNLSIYLKHTACRLSYIRCSWSVCRFEANKMKQVSSLSFLFLRVYLLKFLFTLIFTVNQLWPKWELVWLWPQVLQSRSMAKRTSRVQVKGNAKELTRLSVCSSQWTSKDDFSYKQQKHSPVNDLNRMLSILDTY